MSKQVIQTDKAPAAIGPYSQAIVGNGTIYVSGQIPINPETGVMPETIEQQVAQSMKNVVTLVEKAGGSTETIVKCGIFIRNMADFPKINDVYATFFTCPPPARAVVEVSQLPKGAMVEIEAIALVG
ncbi:Rid family detoxifying hydrolase [Papillibacter cinnamivorans]|uniref:2-iminobutanoate/2-iminopropanoate deaminase n=1 Tax=Papillibacter cinnamivorans DSM 12816 TaxID=1122930 RepID=A0A1W2BLH1_9FIRM|nr:Rid family detoxifying hydrolase [Papillibacter cinnamivorans]SMC73787.1 2-iminobutanoate/2-iminopropanoate deaminase [Papillibacter cinnamivorans DSM 12816]